MRDVNNVFHLAIPCKDIEETIVFYVYGLGCKLARKYDDRVTLDFFGDQLVCHLNPEKIDVSPNMYPRHFGITFKDRVEFDFLIDLAKKRKLRFFKQPFVRFESLPEEHWTFFLIDPANNLLEFKYYLDARMMY